MNYTNREVIRRLKQYDMFLSSLDLAKDENQRERICDQLDKIEKQILLDTNAEYEEEYMHVLGEKVASFEEEKSRLRKLISIIEERKSYLEERKANHKKVTGSLVELTTFLGEDKLTTFKRRLDIIETYERNKEEQEKLMEEMKTLDVKISEASRNVKANTRLDDILENKLEDLVNKTLEKLNLYSLTSKKDEIEEKHTTLEYALDMAKENLKSAKEVNDSYMILECDNILSEVTLEYSKYHEKLYTLKLIDIYDKKAENYDDLVDKREKIDEILKQITSSQLYSEINEELSKELNTIKLQKQELDNYESLKTERQSKRERMTKLEEENTSKEFKIVLDELIKNETRIREEQLRLAKKKEYQEKQERLLEEQKLEASRIRRQKLIEEARMKAQHERLSKVKELQDNTILGTKKEKSAAEKKEEILPEGKSLLEELTEEAKIEEEKVDETFWDSDVITKDLFKENDEPIDLSINFDDIKLEDKKEEAKEEKLIFEESEFNDIPIIENNNLKPELLNSLDEEKQFHKSDEKEGEILWKETL